MCIIALTRTKIYEPLDFPVLLDLLYRVLVACNCTRMCEKDNDGQRNWVTYN